MNILYFEGAGVSDADISKATIGNCRIRTAFHLDNGRAVYLELYGVKRTASMALQRSCKWKYVGYVDACFYITDDKPNDDENLHRVRLPYCKRVFEYTESAILKLVNSLGASFDAIKVLPDLGGYRVFKEKPTDYGSGRYHYSDEFLFNEELLARRQAVYQNIYNIEKDELMRDRAEGGDKFVHAPGYADCPNFSLWVDDVDPGLLHLLRHFNGYNKHWTIRVDCGESLEDWMATTTGAPLGYYGC